MAVFDSVPVLGGGGGILWPEVEMFNFTLLEGSETKETIDCQVRTKLSAERRGMGRF